MKLLSLFFLLISINISAQTIVFIGDSLTEGYQLNKEEAYPALIEKELKKKFNQVKVINAGESGATSASGLKKLKWYSKIKPDIIVLALGANDGLRGMNLKETEKNLSGVIKSALDLKMKILLVGMKMPVNYGEPYRKDFQGLFLKLSNKFSLPIVPFLLEGVGGKPKYNLPDGIHPNPDGHKIMATTVLKHLVPLL
jgi:acyl-CoA thioesterase-1